MDTINIVFPYRKYTFIDELVEELFQKEISKLEIKSTQNIKLKKEQIIS